MKSEKESEVSNFEHHLGQGPEIDLDGETIKLMQLDVDYWYHTNKLTGVFSGMSEKDSMQVFRDITKEESESVVTLIKDTLKKSCPNKDDDWIGKIGMKYSYMLIMKILMINNSMMTTPDQKKKQKIVEELKKRQKQA